jgi:hypothetical protein
MHAMAVALIAAIAMYASAGAVTAVAFVAFGVTRALGDPVEVSAGAGILLLPGAPLLWPYVLWRWLRSGGPR